MIYRKVCPTFWIGETGKKIRKLGIEAQVVAMYLLTSPHANMLGLYYLPVVVMAHETGLTIEGASKALLSLSEGVFCSYDSDSEMVWVHEMAKFQIGEELKPADKRCKYINTEYAQLPNNPFLKEFFEKYGKAYHIKTCRNGEAPSKPLQSPIEASSSSSSSRHIKPARKKSEPAKVFPEREYSPEFLQALAEYPQRDGSQPKTKAWAAWKARLAEGVLPADILAGVQRYAAHVRAKGKEGTEFVLQMATFLGPDKHYANLWGQLLAGAPKAENCAICGEAATVNGRFGARCRDHVDVVEGEFKKVATA